MISNNEIFDLLKLSDSKENESENITYDVALFSSSAWSNADRDCDSDNSDEPEGDIIHLSRVRKK